MCDTAWEKNGVFTAGGNTVHRRTLLRCMRNSACTAWPNPRTAAFAPAYDDISGSP
jgi:hypothetical protein